MSELLPMNGTVLALRQPRMTETALELASDLTAAEWEAIGYDLGRFERASAWWIGDWVNYGEAKWGEKYDEAERITGLAYKTLSVYARTAARFPISHRVRKLSFGHHRIVAAVETQEERRAFLVLAANEGWGRDRLQAHISHSPLNAPLGVAYGKGDKFRDATEPLCRYFKAWRTRDFRYSHLNYKEARKRLKVLDQLAADIEEARADLASRSEPAKLRV